MFKKLLNKLTTMKKDQALTRITSLENEAKELRKIIESHDEPKNIMERVKTFEDACAIMKISHDTFINCCDNDGDSKDEIAYKKLKIIALALNEDWKPNWNNSNEYKYYPYFDMRSGFAFSAAYCAFSYTHAAVGSRLCFKTRALAEYAGKNFENIYKDFLTL